MILARFGHRLIEALHAERGTPRDARAFFDQEVFPVLFDTERFLLEAGNTPFGLADKQAKRKPLTPGRRQEVLREFHRKVEDLDPAGNDVMFGGVAREVSATTSGLVTDLGVPSGPEDAYASWVGAALALTVEGGWGVLVDDVRVLVTAFDGWRAYRRFLDGTPKVKQRQLPAWNAHWVAAIGVEEGDRAIPPSVERAMQSDQTAIPTLSWPQLLFGLSGLIEGPRTAYIFKLGQTNSTLGFVRLELPQVERLKVWYERLFANEAGQTWRDLQRLYEAHYRFDVACRDGVLGLRQLEPKGLRAYLPSPQGKRPRPADPDATPLPISLYLTWIIAMLETDGRDLHERARDAARLLLDYEAGAVGGKTDRRRDVETALNPEYGRYRDFVEGLRPLVEKDERLYEPLDALLRTAARLSEEQFRLFLALLRFHVAGLRRTSSTSPVTS